MAEPVKPPLSPDLVQARARRAKILALAAAIPLVAVTVADIVVDFPWWVALTPPALAAVAAVAFVVAARRVGWLDGYERGVKDGYDDARHLHGLPQ